MGRLLKASKHFIKGFIPMCRKKGILPWPIRKDYRIWNKMNLAQWLVYHQDEIVFTKCYWMGIKTGKNPFDAWIYQEIIHEVKPDIIIEIGSDRGGSTLYFAHLLEILGKGSVISIDIDRKNFEAKHSRIIEITGDSASESVVSKVSELCKNKTVVVVHDGDHHMKHVLNDLRAYSKFVSMNSYFIIEDGIVDLYRPADFPCWPGREKGPLAATEEFLENNPNFIVDKGKERYMLTYNPNGFLKRVK